jgi:3-deoxy-D-manno-octulosonic-acid transferase
MTASAPTFVLRAYAALAHALEPAAGMFLARRVKAGKEDVARLDERRGIASRPRPAGTLVWLHAASVGETIAVLPIAQRLAEAGRTVLLTTVTVTGAKLAAERLPPGAVHQFVPLDLPRAVDRFLDHWRPDLAVLAEQELWPNAIAAIAARQVPLALVNARLSPRSYARWSQLRGTARALLSSFDLVLAKSDADAERFRSLGAQRVEHPGDIKYDAPAPKAELEQLRQLRDALANRPRWVAASTQPGEEEFVLAADAAIRATCPDVVLLLAPRHPPRGNAVEALFGQRGLTVARRSRGELPSATTQVFLLDTIGELGLLYEATTFAFLGGSLVRHGGQNPIEPAKLGVAVLHGPNVHNFVEVYAALDAAGGGQLTNDAAALGREAARLLDNPAAARAMGARAKSCVDALGGGLDRTVAALEALIACARAP